MKVRTKSGVIKEIIYNEEQLLRYGFNRLSEREYGKVELKTKMKRLQSDESMLDRVIEKLENLGYLSDEDRMKSVISQYSKKEGVGNIKRRLQNLGFTKIEIEDNLLIEDNTENIESLIRSKYRSMKDGWENKAYGFLMRKGYKSNDITLAIKNVKNNLQES